MGEREDAIRRVADALLQRHEPPSGGSGYLTWRAFEGAARAAVDAMAAAPQAPERSEIPGGSENEEWRALSAARLALDNFAGRGDYTLADSHAVARAIRLRPSTRGAGRLPAPAPEGGGLPGPGETVMVQATVIRHARLGVVVVEVKDEDGPERLWVSTDFLAAAAPAGPGGGLDREACERLRLFLQWAEQKLDGDPSRELAWGWPATLADLRAALAPLTGWPQ